MDLWQIKNRSLMMEFAQGVMEFVVFLWGLSPILAFFGMCIGFFIVLILSIKYVLKMAQEQMNTTERTMAYVERQFDCIVDEAREKATKLFLENGKMDRCDKDEILRYTDRMTLGFTKAKNRSKSFIRTNGYYHLYSDKDGHFKVLEELLEGRGKEIWRLVNSYVELAFREDSPLWKIYKQVFTKEDAIEAYRQIVSRHVSEIKHEEEMIGNYGKSLFGVLYKFFKYKHE